MTTARGPRRRRQGRPRVGIGSRNRIRSTATLMEARGVETMRSRADDPASDRRASVALYPATRITWSRKSGRLTNRILGEGAENAEDETEHRRGGSTSCSRPGHFSARSYDRDAASGGACLQSQRVQRSMRQMGDRSARPKPRATDLRRYTGYSRVCCGACEWTPVISRMGSTFISYGRSVVRLRSEQHGCPSTQPIWQ